MRPSWDEYFLNIAEITATRSTCNRAYVGAVLVRDKHIIATGYNGSPKGVEHCDDIGHLLVNGHCVRTIHAEQNVIVQASVYGLSSKNSTCYITHFPCLICSKLLINAGIIRIVYKMPYRINEIAVQMLSDAKIEVIEFAKPDTQNP